MHRRHGLIGLLALASAGCAGAITVPAAQHSADPACSAALVAMRGARTLNGAHRVETSTQATAAWGSDGRIQLRCGLPALGPSTDRCQTVTGVDWVVTQTGGRTVFTAFGRSPTLAVSVAGQDPPQTDALLATVASAAKALPANGHRCL